MPYNHYESWSDLLATMNSQAPLDDPNPWRSNPWEALSHKPQEAVTHRPSRLDASTDPPTTTAGLP